MLFHDSENDRVLTLSETKALYESVKQDSGYHCGTFTAELYYIFLATLWEENNIRILNTTRQELQRLIVRIANRINGGK